MGVAYLAPYPEKITNPVFMSKLKKFWADPVWSKVIASTIVGAFAITVPTILGLWPAILAKANEAWAYALSSSTLPTWLVVIGAICTAIVSLVVSATLWRIAFPGKPVVSWHAYMDDVFLGLQWQWRYDSDNDIAQLVPLCAQCSYQLQPRDVSDYRAVPTYAYRCDLCNRAHEFAGHPEELRSKIVRMIQQKLRTDTWPRNQVRS